MNAPIDVAGRVAVVLRALGRFEPEGATTTVIARHLNLPRPTAHRILGTLREHGLADRDRATDRWTLGAESYLLGIAAAERYDVTEVAQPYVRRLSEATAESAFFSIRRGDETVCLIREDGAFPLRSHVLNVGTRFPLGVVSSGMAVLAHLPDAEVQDYLRRVDLASAFGDRFASAEIRQNLESTRLEGYATNPGLVVRGSWGMAAAVFDRSRRPQWALSLTGVEHRFQDERRPHLGAMLLREAHALGLALCQPSIAEA